MLDVASKTDGVSTLSAAEFNSYMVELENMVTMSGQALNGAIAQQLMNSVSIYAAGGNSYVDSGTANAYVLSPVGAKVAPPAYFNGMKVYFKVGNANTGASTVNVATLGNVNIKQTGGADPASGALPLSAIVGLWYNSSAGYFEIQSVNTAQNNVFQVTQQYFGASGTYTPTPGMAYCLIQLVGGGGSGAAGGPSVDRGGGGGGGGDYAENVFSATNIGVSKAVTIGAGGAAVSGSSGTVSGNNGNQSSVGSLIAASGGGAAPSVGGVPNIDLGSGGPGGNGNSGSSTPAGQGQGGGSGIFLDIGGNIGGFSGEGGSSRFGGGGASVSASSSANGIAGGVGGGGSGSVNGGTSGKGGDGGVLITEYIL